MPPAGVQQGRAGFEYFEHKSGIISKSPNDPEAKVHYRVDTVRMCQGRFQSWNSEEDLDHGYAPLNLLHSQLGRIQCCQSSFQMAQKPLGYGLLS